MLHPSPKPTIAALLTASDVDHIAEISSHWPARFTVGWRTGIPAHDHLLAERLPFDLERQEQQLRNVLGDRRLVLYMASDRPVRPGRAGCPFDGAEVERLAGLAEERGALIGVREPSGDLIRPYAAAFGDMALDLSPTRFPSTAVLLRSADALITDYDGSALDFLITGRPVVSFAPDLDEQNGELFFDLEHLFPGPVCRDVDALCDSLATIFDVPSLATARHYARVRDLLIDHRDGQNAARAVNRVRHLLEEKVA